MKLLTTDIVYLINPSYKKQNNKSFWIEWKIWNIDNKPLEIYVQLALSNCGSISLKVFTSISTRVLAFLGSPTNFSIEAKEKRERGRERESAKKREKTHKNEIFLHSVYCVYFSFHSTFSFHTFIWPFLSFSVLYQSYSLSRSPFHDSLLFSKLTLGLSTLNAAC